MMIYRRLAFLYPPLSFLRLGLLLLLTAGVGYVPPAQAQAQSTQFPLGFTQALVVSGLTTPTSMAFAPDGRLFVTEQTGALRVIENGVLLPTPFITLTVTSVGERGLLGLAFDPDFTNNQFLYLYYTVPGTPAHNRVSRFTANGNVAATSSEVVVLELNDLSSATNHNGGALHFGLDGRLYVAVGENRNRSNSQTLENLLGKVLRINPDGSIPTDNPFYGAATGQNRAIWALGLRNPFTFAFQPGTGRMFINDVGQNTWEEVNDGIAGSNYGWPVTEGVSSNPSFQSPVYAYDHSQGCAITGGTFYNPVTEAFPPTYRGDYFFADFCGSWIRRYDSATNSVKSFASNTPSLVVDLDVDDNGALYLLARQSGITTGAVYRVNYACSRLPITSPANAAPIQNIYSIDTPTLTWSPLTWAVGYAVQVDNASNFADPDYENDQLTAGELSLTTEPLQNCVYYWRVRGKLPNSQWGPWSKAEPFVVAAP